MHAHARQYVLHLHAEDNTQFGLLQLVKLVIGYDHRNAENAVLLQHVSLLCAVGARVAKDTA